MKTIADGLNQREDNFLLLRFIAAAMVIYGHAPSISGGGGPRDLLLFLDWGLYSGSLAVEMFFVISGFLIAGSFFRRRHLASFIWARAVRIIPAYAVCLVILAAVIGPIFSSHSMQSYFSNPQTYAYVSTNLRFGIDQEFRLPGVFSGNPKTDTVNGPIWTLPVEVRMYLFAALLGMLGILWRRWAFNVLFIGLLVLGALFPNGLPLAPPQEGYPRLSVAFVAGVFCFVNASWLPRHWGAVAATALLAYTFRSTAAYPYFFVMAEVAFVFWFAYDTRWHGFNRLGDYSYGLYLWGWPTQQMVAALCPDLPDLANALVAFGVALFIAVASWRFVEKPALRLKTGVGRLPRASPEATLQRTRANAAPIVPRETFEGPRSRADTP